MSKTVRDRAQRCLTVVLAGYSYGGILGEAALRMMGDFLRRESEDLSPKGDKRDSVAAGGLPRDRPRTPSLRDVLRLGARDLEQRRDAMVEADTALERTRAELRRRRARRDRRARRLYDFLASIRKLLKTLLGYEAANDYLGMRGPTPRDPHALLRDARYVAGVLGDPARAPECAVAENGRLKTSDLARRLGALCDPLAGALSAVTAAACAEVAAQEHQRRAIAEFDWHYLHTARLFERMLDYCGLPTLASTVRPGVKRRGRPPKVQPVDDYPDLVERALGRGVLESGDASRALARVAGIETATGIPTPSDAGSPDPAPMPIEGVAGGLETDSGPKVGKEKSPDSSIEPPAGARKIETASDKPVAGARKIEIGSRKPAEAEQKSETGARKPAEAEQKSETGARKPRRHVSRPLDGTFSRPRLNRRRRRGLVFGVDPLLHRRSRRHRRSGSSPGLAASASAWWRRLRDRAS